MAQVHPFEHDVVVVRGRAREWYWRLYDEIIGNHRAIQCRQGLALESPHSLVALLPFAEDVYSAMATIDVPRRQDEKQRITASILDSLRRILGYHETVLFDKYPIMHRYTKPQVSRFYPRASMYLRESIPSEMVNEPWICRTRIGEADFYSIDQIQRAVWILSNPQTRHSKRALVDFGDGYKARCMLNWLFTIRDNSLFIYVQMRSNDLLIGLPNNLVDGRVAQLVMAACIGTQIGPIHYQSDLVQIYNPDVAGLRGKDILAKLLAEDKEETEFQTLLKMKEIPILKDLWELLTPYMGNPTADPSEGLARWRKIMAGLERLFWLNNAECKPENRQCVAHLIGRYDNSSNSV